VLATAYDAPMMAEQAETMWGPWSAWRLQDEILALAVVPAVGGRVVSLLDRRTGREWLTQGDPPDATSLGRWSTEDATFGGRESFGWDECLPTVTRCADPLDPAAPPLRDHGDLWGRSCVVTADARGLTTRWESHRWPMTLERRLSIAGDGVVRAGYTLRSQAQRSLPVLWSAHPALRLEPGTRIELRGITSTRVVGVLGWPFDPGESVPWPEPVAGFDASLVRPIEQRAAAKLYAATTLARVVASDGAALTFEADGGLVRTIGVWLDAGGWPADRPIHQVALEPTGSPDDHVADASANGRAWTLPPGGTLRWSMRLRLDAGQGPQTDANV
jgi:galactose mutarotase-like enzyme